MKKLPKWLIITLVLSLFSFGSFSFAAPSVFDKQERDYYDWPDVLSVAETVVMKPANIYIKDGNVIETEFLSGTWKYVSLNDKVVRVLPDGKTLQGVAPGTTTLRLEITEVKKSGSTTTTTTIKWTTTKTISVAAKQHNVADKLKLTPQQIKAVYDQHTPLFVGSPFISAPRIQSPFATGKLSDGFLQDGLRMTNFVRFLAGLPNNVELDIALNLQAQHGAVLNAHWNELDHTPSKPTSMDETFYKKAYQATSSSNLSYGMETLDGQVRGFMDDLGLNNVAEVGHRRWIMNPGLKKIGFGMSKSVDNEFYGTMQVFDESGNVGTKVVYDTIGWPSAGHFPVDFFDAGAVWSLSLNPAIYDATQTAGISVSLSETGGKTWTLNSNDNAITETEEFFRVSKKGTGIPFAIMFRPDSSIELDHGDVFTVKVSGVRHKTQGVKTLTYQVQFFGLDQVQGVTGKTDFPSSAEVQRPTGKSEILIYINGKQKIYDQAPIKANNSVLVPLRGIVENLGAGVSFNTGTQTITATKGTRKVILRVGQKTATVNGRSVPLSQPAISSNGRVFVPLRFVSESFSAGVKWEPIYNAVVITFAK